MVQPVRSTKDLLLHPVAPYDTDALPGGRVQNFGGWPVTDSYPLLCLTLGEQAQELYL